MSVRAKSEKGFSLIELLVVVAVIGVLTSVIVVGYQGYIEIAKKSATEANAKAVQNWVLNTGMVRAAGIDADPTSCNASKANTEATIQACLASIGGVDGPFANFENPYNASRTGNTTIRGQLSSATISNGVTECKEIDAGAEAGDVLVSVSGTVIQTHYCVPSEDSNVLLTQMDWEVDWD